MIKTQGAKIFAAWAHKKNAKWIKNPIKTQEKVFLNLIKMGRNTLFGKHHEFDKITTIETFKCKIPIRDYEGLREYIEMIISGEQNILWPGRPLYFAKSSGTTSGIKYIPITKDAIHQHIRAAREALLNYIYFTNNSSIVNGKHIFIQGSPFLENKNGVAIGRLSGIVAHHVPTYLQKNRMPTWHTNCIEDWDTKVNAIVEETYDKDMTIIGGIPSWVQMYFEKLVSKTNKNIGDLFPNFSLFVYGGVNFEPYKGLFKKFIGRIPDSIEFYPASEVFFAYQDNQNDKGLLLLLNHGIYYEFVVSNTFYDQKPTIHNLNEVILGVNYVMIISTSSGLWRYNIGDTIKFTNKFPFRVIVSGRIKHFISAFGEHVIVSEVEQSLKEAIEKTEDIIRVKEFTVAPQIAPKTGLPYHEWFIEFETPPKEKDTFANNIDFAMKSKNIYYNDLIEGKILRPLVITVIQKNGFQEYMKSIGKLGGQNKVPRVSDNRLIADSLKKFTTSV